MIITDGQLSNLVLEKKIVDNKKLEDILSSAKNNDQSLADALIDKEIISEENLTKILAEYLKIKIANLSEITLDLNLVSLIPEKVARKQKLIIFAQEKDALKVAMVDPTDQEIINLISQKTGKKIVPYLVAPRDLENSLKIYRKDIQNTFDLLLVGNSKLGAISEDTPVAKIADLLIEYAYQDKASDIHIEPEEKYCLIRFRLDGVLHDVLRLPKNLHERIVSRIKVLSKLRTDEHLSPQDGKMRLQLDRENLDIRVSVVPVADGEKIVLRLLSSKSRQFSLQDLGMNPVDLQKVTRAFSKSFGMVLATGPTGSGKTTSIYSILKILNSRDKNITTIEDPVEYRIQGVNQIQVNPKTSLNFSNGLRSILRQDPNIIFVGEIRDNDTAAIAVNAALTGHLVLSTLHTNDAATTIPRFIDMKVEPFLVASTINIIIAQRLVRKICHRCRQEITVTVDELTKNLSAETITKNFGHQKTIKLFRGAGCDLCHHTGYYGRIGIYEVMEMNNKIRKLISKKCDSETILTEAINNGLTTMFEDGLQKCLQGLTTIEEILRVTKTESLWKQKKWPFLIMISLLSSATYQPC